VSLLLALLLQVGPDPMSGGMRGDDLVQGRPPRQSARSPQTEQEITDPTSAWLQSCLDAIGTDAARAHTMAQIRRTQTTGTERVLANHCLGTAASELGLWEDARSAFMAAHDETPEGETRARARFTMMAGNAALAGGDSEGALALLTQAGAEAQSAAAASLQAIAAIDRARALVALDRQDEALVALNEATGLAPESSEGWLLKATLLRRMDRLDAAQIAIEAAARLAPGAPEIGLEAGVIAVLAGRDEAARASWQSVIDLAAESDAAKQAKDYLVQLGPAPAAPATAQEPPA
jgi:tetratricopeptide (TPR) repeat protein